MMWLIPLLGKLALWALPKLAGNLIDRLQNVLVLVASAEQMADPKARRDTLLRTLTAGGLPEWLARAEVEVGVLLFRLGLTADSLNVLESLVSSKELYEAGADGATKRNAVLEEFLNMCPTVSESAARLLIQVLVAKVRSTGITKIPPAPPEISGTGVPPVDEGDGK